MSSTNLRFNRIHALAAATTLVICGLSAPAFAGKVYLGNLLAEGNNRFIVKYKTGSAPANSPSAMSSSLNHAASRIALSGGSQAKTPALRAVRQMILPGGRVIASDVALNRAQAEGLMREIAADPNVEFVQRDGLSRMLLTPNDPRFAQQWHYADSAVGIRAPTAWNTANGSGVVVAVIDSGILAHADLNANILPGYDFVSSLTGYTDAECRSVGATPGCGKSDDGDGRDANPNDSSFVQHGTHVAGTIGAVTNNGVGVAGVAFGSKVVPIRVLGNQGFGSDADIADAMVWASGGSIAGVPANPNPAEVINMSLGGDTPCSQTPAYQAAANTALANGSIVIAAAGNSSIDVAGATPAGCNNVVSVAASNKSGGISYYSSFGATIDITAPGGAQSVENDPNGVLSTYGNGGYSYIQGTSMAAPHAAGVAALIISASATPKTPAQIEQILESTARPISASNCSRGCGAGIIDAAAAVAAASGGGNPNPGTQTYSNTADVNIPDNNATGASSSIVVSGRTGNAPANASVTINIVHAYKNELIVDLIAPDGSVYNLHNRTGTGANLSGTYTVNLSSEALNGTWRLRAADRVARDVGRINEWSVTF